MSDHNLVASLHALNSLIPFKSVHLQSHGLKPSTEPQSSFDLSSAVPYSVPASEFYNPARRNMHQPGYIPETHYKN
jgi:hypothetical protein